MLKEYLDKDIYNLVIKSFSFNDITEIRMRTGERLIIAIKNKKYFLKTSNGQYVIVTKQILDNFIRKISENSLYAFNDSIVKGYITLPKGIRVGLSGTAVMNGEKVVTIKDFQSVNIRIPHTIRNCSLLACDYLVDDDIHNTLIISAPGCGKTTFLRDLIYQINERKQFTNLLIVDERSEIIQSQNTGGFCDIYTNCSKDFAFNNGIRSMSPDVILTDEIDLNKDLSGIVEAMNSGVKVVATIHAKDIEQLRMKKGFQEILDKRIFSRFVVLNKDNGPGTLANIFDEKLNCIYCNFGAL